MGRGTLRLTTKVAYQIQCPYGGSTSPDKTEVPHVAESLLAVHDKPRKE